jgi:adenylyl- and sulfurtransferase ThiI
MENAWILRFGELGLKSKVVRRQFQRGLYNNMEILAKFNGISLKQDRIISMEVITSDNETDIVEDTLCRLLGVVAIDPAMVISDSIDPKEVAQKILNLDENFGKSRTFGVRTKRLGPKENFSTKEYNGQIGYWMLQLDDSLKVNLTNPDIWVRVVLEQDKVWLLSKRLNGAGGLPPGVQGDVLCKVTTEDEMISAFLIMRRGSRLIPVEGSDEKLIDELRKWDPSIGKNSKIKDIEGKIKQRYPWGVVGLSVEEGEKQFTRSADEVKTVPLSTLEPICGWTDLEKENLLKHIRNPKEYISMPNFEAWMDDARISE